MKKDRPFKNHPISIYVLLLIILLSSSSACRTNDVQNSQKADNSMPIKTTYEEQVTKMIESVEGVPAGLPSDEITAKLTLENYDAKTNHKRLKTVYLKILALDPPKHQKATHKRILRSLKYAIDGMTILTASDNTLNQSKLTQGLLLVNLNIDDIRKMKDKLLENSKQ